MHELNIPSKIEFAPYNQVFQQLLDPTSLLSKNQNGINIILIRIEDWERLEGCTEAVSDTPSDTYEKIERNVRDFVNSLKFALARSIIPYLVCICPTSTEATTNPDRLTFFIQMEKLITSELDKVRKVYLITPAELLATYPISKQDDPYGEALANIPFTSLFFTALGTMIARKIHALQSTPYKVIVLDCDQTLWKGVCGEDGAMGVEIDPPRRALQELMLTQQQAGKLICLCSKNDEVDVLEVFERHPDMILRRNHITAWQINWKPKSENLQSLAKELRLTLDSFIFMDDDPVECAEVQVNCPEVLVLQLPQKSEDIPQFLTHVWAFDPSKKTEEDTKRGTYYRQNLQRERLHRESPSLEDFLAKLDLEVLISEMGLQHLPRVSQLTQRTNQFNCTTLRRSESEIQNLCQSGKLKGLVVEVKDRFGDYGLVGAILFLTVQDVLYVDTFLLSCRALGRGVEHRMLARLGEIAKIQGLSYVMIPYIPTKKNQPAHNFLESIGAPFKGQGTGSRGEIDGLSLPVLLQDVSSTLEILTGKGWLYRFPAGYAATLTPFSSHSGGRGQGAGSSVPLQETCEFAERKTRSQLLSQIAREWWDIEQILKVIHARRRSRPDLQTIFVPPRTPTEETLVKIWAELLGLERVGIHDYFFDLGGHSLLVYQLLSRVHEAFQVKLSSRVLFTSMFTVAEMAKVIELYQIENADPGEITALLKELNELSDEEIKELLEKQQAGGSRQKTVGNFLLPPAPCPLSTENGRRS